MAGFQEKLYANLPVFAQNWAISVYGYHWKQRRFGGVFEQELYGFREREAYTADQWRDYQTVQLRRLLLHAYDTVPFYREKYSAQGFHRGDFERFELEQLPLLPFLEKEELRRFGTTTLLSSKREKGGQFFSSSGSTGTPTQILYSHAFHQRWSAAFESRIREWAGLHRGLPRGMIGGRRIIADGIASPPFYRYNAAEKQVYFSAYHISKQNISSYFNGIKKYNLSYLTGYAMSNFFLARFFEESGISVPNVQAVVTSSEVLTDEMRAIFQRVYGCKTYDSYSGVEACALISETKSGHLLSSPDVGIIEVVGEEGRYISDGDSGELVCTGLLNVDQPLIRYRIKDRVRLSENQNEPGGRNMPVISQIEGRVEDVIIGQDGREMVRFHGVFLGLPNVRKAQVVQYDYTHFEILIEITQPLSTEERQEIYRRMASQLGDITVDIKELATLPLGLNGKFQAVISHVRRCK